MPDGYPALEKHLKTLTFPQDGAVLVPLCGKSVDLIKLSKYFGRVVGVEVSEKAILEFFREQKLEYSESTFANFKIYSSGKFELWCGDFLKLPAHKIKPLDLIYDKAALVALPENKRGTYMEKMLSLTSDHTDILLHHFIYAQHEMPGPPFSVTDGELMHYMGTDYQTKILGENRIDINRFKKFQKRGLKSGLMERFILFTSKS
jgi:thiopurine S-methyltransferase